MAQTPARHLGGIGLFTCKKPPLYLTASIVMAIGGSYNGYVTCHYQVPLDVEFPCAQIGHWYHRACIRYGLLPTRHCHNICNPTWSVNCVLYPLTLCNHLYLCREPGRRSRSTTRSNHRLLRVRPRCCDRSRIDTRRHVHCWTHHHRNWDRPISQHGRRVYL